MEGRSGYYWYSVGPRPAAGGPGATDSERARASDVMVPPSLPLAVSSPAPRPCLANLRVRVDARKESESEPRGAAGLGALGLSGAPHQLARSRKGALSGTVTCRRDEPRPLLLSTSCKLPHPLAFCDTFDYRHGSSVSAATSSWLVPVRTDPAQFHHWYDSGVMDSAKLDFCASGRVAITSN